MTSIGRTATITALSLIAASATRLAAARDHGQSQPIRALAVAATIGEQEGLQYEFELTRALLATSAAGGVLVTQPDRGEVREFDRSGRWVRTLGRRGRGPGEFLNIHALRVSADTVFVGDGAARRLTLFVRGGKPITTELSVVPPKSILRGVSAGGATLFLSTMNAAELVDGQRKGELVVLNDVGVALARRGVRIASTVLGIVHNGVSTVRLTDLDPLSRDDLVAVSPSGRTTYLLSRDTPVRGDSVRARITTLSADGKELRSMLLVRPARRVDGSAVNGVLERFGRNAMRLRPGAFSSVAGAVESAKTQLSIPVSYPAVGELIAENDSLFWISTSRAVALSGNSTAPSDAVVWECLDLSGRVVRRVRVPARVTLQSVHGEVFWGTSESGDGVPLIVRLQ